MPDYKTELSVLYDTLVSKKYYNSNLIEAIIGYL